MFILHQGWCGPFVGSGLGHLSGDAGPVEVGKAWNCGGPQWKGEGGRGTKGRWRNKMMLSWNAAKRNYVGGKSRPTMVHFHKMWWHFSDVWIHLCFLLQNFRVRPPELVFWVPAWFFFFFFIISRGKTGWVSLFQPYVSHLASRGWHLISSTFCGWDAEAADTISFSNFNELP